MVALTLDKIAVFYRETKRWDLGTENAEKAIALRAIFLANGFAIEATARQGHGDTNEAELFLRLGAGGAGSVAAGTSEGPADPAKSAG